MKFKKGDVVRHINKNIRGNIMKTTKKELLNDILDIIHGNQHLPNYKDTRSYPDFQQKVHDIELYCRVKLK